MDRWNCLSEYTSQALSLYFQNSHKFKKYTSTKCEQESNELLSICWSTDNLRGLVSQLFVTSKLIGRILPALRQMPQ